MRPSSIYIEAANNAGARSKNRDCTMYGVSVNRGASVLETIRAAYPMISTIINMLVEGVFGKVFGNRVWNTDKILRQLSEYRRKHAF